MPDAPSALHISAGSLAVAASVPGLVALAFVWLSRRRVGRGALAGLFVFGGLAVYLLAAGMNRLLAPVEAAIAGDPESIRAGLAEMFLTAALPEEAARLLVALSALVAFRGTFGRNAELSCGVIGLGFAAYENAVYSLLMRGPGEVLVARSLVTVGHGALGLIMGSLLGRALASGRPRPGRLALAFLVPFLLHGVYDYGVFLIERQELPELSAQPTGPELRALGVAIAQALPTLAVWIVEMAWAARIVWKLRAEGR